MCKLLREVTLYIMPQGPQECNKLNSVQIIKRSDLIYYATRSSRMHKPAEKLCGEGNTKPIEKHCEERNISVVF